MDDAVRISRRPWRRAVVPTPRARSGVVWALALLLLIAAPYPAVLAQGPASVSEMVRQLQDAVVNIGTSRTQPGRSAPFPQTPPDTRLEEFFGQRGPLGPGPNATADVRTLGSGFIISSDGMIVTNDHVVREARDVIVFLSDGTRLLAEVLGRDDKTDIALLKVEAGRELTFASFGDSDRAEVGDWVMAIGNPFGLGGSVSIGIVSARNRDINNGPYDNFIQTDAAINQGNSGGPLFDMHGEVIGITTAIVARGGGSLGIGFAIPGNVAVPVIEQLAEFGETRRGWLGVGIQDVSLDMAQSLGRDNSHGALVLDVTRGGPGEGVIEHGDIILEFNGRPIERMRDLPLFVAQAEIGAAAELLVLRGGVEQVLSVTLGQLESDRETIARVTPTPVTGESGIVSEPSLADLLGLELGILDIAAREEHGVSDALYGVVINRVHAGSDASVKGVVAGLVIEEVNQLVVVNVADIEAIVGRARAVGRPAVLLKLVDPTGLDRYVAVRFR